MTFLKYVIAKKNGEKVSPVRSFQWNCRRSHLSIYRSISPQIKEGISESIPEGASETVSKRMSKEVFKMITEWIFKKDGPRNFLRRFREVNQFLEKVPKEFQKIAENNPADNVA